MLGFFWFDLLSAAGVNIYPPTAAADYIDFMSLCGARDISIATVMVGVKCGGNFPFSLFLFSVQRIQRCVTLLAVIQDEMDLLVRGIILLRVWKRIVPVPKSHLSLSVCQTERCVGPIKVYC